jgi:hypothetical protein
LELGDREVGFTKGCGLEVEPGAADGVFEALPAESAAAAFAGPDLAAHFAAEFASVETTDDFAAERLIKDALAIRSTLAAATGLAMSVKQRAVLGDGGMTHNLSSGALDGSISIKGF